MKIMIDAGHGYNTPGKRSPDGSMREWEFNSATAEYVKAILTDYENVQVEFAHDPTGKTDIGLSERTAHASEWGADVYVSIHANSLDGQWSDAGGIETFHHPESSEESKQLAKAVQAELVAVTGLRRRGVKTANLHVLRETKMPAILAECGFMSNKHEAKLLKSDEYRQKCGQAIAEALIAFYKLKPERGNSNESPTSAPKNKPKANLDIDGSLGPETISALQRYFGTPVDGVISKPSMVVKALQKLLGVKQDGYLGPNTISAMQKRFATPVDGKISEPSLVIKELQRRLNRGQL